nr:immunoglobulin heavy chain junction region [Mus musculus]MBK4197820.1 immunoglobulin heavy chain junction region [Mus musculus]MBK4197821.1 immunoglobulin heavy chain junction region [Mus musculus]
CARSYGYDAYFDYW